MGRRYHVADEPGRMDGSADGPQTLSEERARAASAGVRESGRSGSRLRPRSGRPWIRMTRITRDYVVPWRERPTELRDPDQGGRNVTDSWTSVSPCGMT